MGLREAMTSFLCVPRPVLIWSQTSVSHWRRQSIHENVTVSTMGLPFFIMFTGIAHRGIFFFPQTMADYYQGLGLTFSHCVDVWVCIELWRWGNILSTAARLMFVALKPRLNIDIMANFGLWYNTSWFSRELTWWNIR